MMELRLHKELYASDAIGVAIEAFAPFAQIERREESAHWVVAIAAKPGEDELQIAGELGNYALGATVDGVKREGGTR